jgi:hypothetical protein
MMVTMVEISASNPYPTARSQRSLRAGFPEEVNYFTANGAVYSLSSHEKRITPPGP